MKNKTKKHRFSAKVDSFLLGVLYLAVLSITTFHHHPIDLLGIENTVAEKSDHESRHAYTTAQCPIVNFNRTGFNSLSIENSTESKFSPKSADYILVLQNLHYQNFFSYFSSRGPPSNKIV